MSKFQFHHLLVTFANSACSSCFPQNNGDIEEDEIHGIGLFKHDPVSYDGQVFGGRKCQRFNFITCFLVTFANSTCFNCFI